MLFCVCKLIDFAHNVKKKVRLQDDRINRSHIRGASIFIQSHSVRSPGESLP